MPLELFMAWRYLKAKRKGLFAVLTTAIGIAGVAVGVAALITTLSVMNGFQADIQKKILGAQAMLTVFRMGDSASLAGAERTLRDDSQVAAYSPFTLSQAVATIGGRSSGVVLKGIDPAREFGVNELAGKLQSGSWQALRGGKVPGIVLGEELARTLGAWPGDSVVLVSPSGLMGAFGVVPRMERFRVAGLLHTGYYEYDSTTAYSDIASALKLSGEPGATRGFGVRLHDIAFLRRAKKSLQRSLGGGFFVRSYEDMNQTLFAALKLEKATMFIILALIILVASLNIASTLILRTVEKTRDIALLKAMGAGPRLVLRVFLAEGTIIAAIGLTAGVTLGLFLCWLIRTYPIVKLPADIYYLSRLPVDVEPLDVTLVIIVGFFLCLLATIYPAWRASKVKTVEALHYG